MTHSIPNLHPDWITNRLPTRADTDVGDVRIPLTVQGAAGGPKGTWAHWCHYSVVALGQPWWSEKAAANASPPATPPAPAPAPTRKVVQIEATPESKNCYSCLHALCNDDSIFEIAFRPGIPDVWRQLPPIPQPGDQ